MRILKNITLLRNDGGLLSGLHRNAFASLVHFADYKREGFHHSVVVYVVFLDFSHPCLVSVLFLLETNFFPLVSILFWGVTKPTSK